MSMVFICTSANKVDETNSLRIPTQRYVSVPSISLHMTLSSTGLKCWSKILLEGPILHTERLKAKQAKMPSISLDRTFCVPSKKHPQHFPYLSLPYAEILKPYKIPRSFLCVNHFRKHQGPRENPKALDLLVSHHPKIHSSTLKFAKLFFELWAFI